MTEYSGHRSWNAWNVSLWFHNDEPLYRHAYALAQRHGIAKASRILSQELDGEKTPDGARYNPTCIREAMREILD